jgi:hypothetical protein
MAEDQEQGTEAEFISAADDAALRLKCFELASATAPDFADNLRNAKVIYDWIMDTDSAEDGVELTPTGEAECSRKH